MGASPVSPEVMAAVNELVPHSVDMLELQSVACRAIADSFETEAGLVVNCSAAGIVAAVAACMAGEDLALAQRLPDSTGLKQEVILQRGHNIDYGAPITGNILIAGARAVEIGAATECETRHLAAAITPQTAAALYVVSASHRAERPDRPRDLLPDLPQVQSSGHCRCGRRAGAAALPARRG